VSHRTARPETAQPPTGPRLQLFLGPEVSLAGELVEGAAPAVFEAPVLRPQDLSVSHGFAIRREHLEEMAAAYDPQIEEAVLNFDHDMKGPAHGFVEELQMRGEVLWARFSRLSTDAVEAIRSGRWPRRSSELVRKHPATGGWYYTGCALLGAARPAIWGISQQGVLLSGNPVEVVDLGAPMTAPDGATHQEADTMPIELAGEPEPVETPEPETLAAPDDQVTKLQAELAAERAKSRRLEARARAASDLEKLGARVTPAMRRAGLPALLEELAAADAPQTVTLSAGDGAPREAAVYDALLSVLQACPEAEILSHAPLAAREAEEAARLALDNGTPEELAVRERYGITPERAVELRRKFPRAFSTN